MSARVRRDPAGSDACAGSVVFSLDAELAWGFHDQTDPPIGRIEGARDGWLWLLEAFDEYRVPATWAVVGQLFLDDRDRTNPALDAPAEWFAFDSEHWPRRPGLRYGSELVDALLAADVEHDVGSHSLAHLLFDDPRVSREAVDADLAAAVEVAADRGRSLGSFVFPRNRVGHRDVLAEHGFRIYRGRSAVPEPVMERAASKLAALLDPSRVPLVEPTVDEYGLVDLPPSLYLFGFEGRARSLFERVWTDPMVRLATHTIDRAAREGGICHLWLHPNNVVDERDRRRVRAILEHAALRRDDGEIVIETMADVAERVLAAEESRRETAAETPLPRSR